MEQTYGLEKLNCA